MKPTPVLITAALCLTLGGCVIEPGVSGGRYDSGFDNGYFGDTRPGPGRVPPSRWSSREAYEAGESFGARDRRQGLNDRANHHIRDENIPTAFRDEFRRGYSSGWRSTTPVGNNRPGYDRDDNRRPGYDRDDNRRPGYDRDDNRRPDYDRDDYRRPGYDSDDYRGTDRDRDNYRGPGNYPSQATQWTARDAYQNGFTTGTADRQRGLQNNPSAHLGNIPSQVRNDFRRGYTAGWSAPTTGTRRR